MTQAEKSLADTNLFKAIKVGSVTLQNRLVFAPTTRFRNTEDNVATDSMLQYYTERATNNGGLIITEATSPAPEFGTYAHTPMIYTPAQVEAWKKIVDSVHSQGTSISLQLWHLGRTADPKRTKALNLPFVSSSNKYADKDSEKAAAEAGIELKAMSLDEIKDFKQGYVEAAKRAIFEAGFDFIELHGAHGYLLDQFIQEGTNDRTDKYGGSIENRSRLLLELVDLVIDAVGADHVAIRFSPYAKYQGSVGVDSPNTHPIAQFGYILGQLEKRAKEGNRLAYISVVEPRVNENDDLVTVASKDNQIARQATRTLNTSWIGEIWKGVIIRAGVYLHDANEGYAKLRNDVNADDRTLIAAGRYYTSNPDLAERLKKGLSLTPYDRLTFYKQFSNDGYITWGKYGEEELAKDSTVRLKVPKPLA